MYDLLDRLSGLRSALHDSEKPTYKRHKLEPKKEFTILYNTVLEVRVGTPYTRSSFLLETTSRPYGLSSLDRTYHKEKHGISDHNLIHKTP